MNYTSHMLAAMETVECITILVTYIAVFVVETIVKDKRASISALLQSRPFNYAVFTANRPFNLRIGI